ncbi:MAG: hypothetical protein ACP5QP_06195 [Brevinematia bacterium]
MVGVILFSLIGMFVGFLSAERLIKDLIGKSDFITRFFNVVDKFDLFISIGGIFVGVWNFFSPNFGFKFDIPGADLPIIGAAIPSLLIVISSISIGINYFLQILNIPSEEKEKLLNANQNYGDLIGVVTFLFSFLHILTYQTVLL